MTQQLKLLHRILFSNYVWPLLSCPQFGLLLWALTYIGSWFNGLSLIILGKFVRNSDIRYLLMLVKY